MSLNRKNDVDSSILELLIKNGVNLKATGWVEFKNEWIFGTPLELATKMLGENESENRRKSFQILELLSPEEKEISEKLSAGTVFFLFFFKENSFHCKIIYI